MVSNGQAMHCISNATLKMLLIMLPIHVGHQAHEHVFRKDSFQSTLKTIQMLC